MHDPIDLSSLDDKQQKAVGFLIDQRLKPALEMILPGVIAAAIKAPLTEALKPLEERMGKIESAPRQSADPKADGPDKDPKPAALTADDVSKLVAETLDKRDSEMQKSAREKSTRLEATKAWLKAKGFGKVIGTPIEERFADAEDDAAREKIVERINAELKVAGATPLAPTKAEDDKPKAPDAGDDKLTGQQRLALAEKQDMEAQRAAKEHTVAA